MQEIGGRMARLSAKGKGAGKRKRRPIKDAALPLRIVFHMSRRDDRALEGGFAATGLR